MNDQTPFQNDNAAQIITLSEIHGYLDGAKTVLLDADANLVCARAFLEHPLDAVLLGGIAYDLEGLARRLEPVRHRIRAELDQITGEKAMTKAKIEQDLKRIVGCRAINQARPIASAMLVRLMMEKVRRDGRANRRRTGI